ncbi:MAG: BamA/TamA family outer membrane protein, partial [Vicinamibacteria bacterium]|nr:BamA/TamA family outer membrane protein [Vicinamibacteria bacterium]
LQTEHFDIHYYAEEEEAVRVAGRMAERWYARLTRLLDYSFADRQPLILYASSSHFQQTNTLGSEPGEGTGGVTEFYKRRIILPFAGPLEETDHVIGHELVHAFQYAMSGQGRSVMIETPPIARLPLWFVEGMAEYLTIGPADAHTTMWMRDAVRKGKLPTIRKLDNYKYFPYRWGQAFWAYVAGRWGDAVVGRLLKEALRGGDAEAAIKKVLGMKSDALSKEWHAALTAAYQPQIEAKPKLTAVARPLIVKHTGGGRINVSPAVSPDGSQLIFLSEKSRFSIEMFLADVKTGRVSERLSKTAVDPHFDTLQFIDSAGSWDEPGRRFAFAAISQGRPVLSILSVKDGKRVREVRFDNLDQIANPTWSPDGRSVAFTGMKHGLLDLYCYDLTADKMTRLTEDHFAELQPVWSPDGKTIAFATDRFDADPGALVFGSYRLAVMDVASRTIRELPSFRAAKNINPQWSQDSQSLFFLSDRSGVTNIYRLDLSTGSVYQLTDLYTGVSGITALSPSLTVARQANQLLFTVYEDDRYEIYAIDAPEKLNAQVVEGDQALTDAAILPPANRQMDAIRGFKEDASFGLPDGGTFRTTAYKSRLTLDAISQPYIGVGADRFGTYVGGGISLMFSDMLGDRNLGLYLQANGEFADVAVAATYINRESRWNWGVSVEQIPYLSGSYASYYGADFTTEEVFFKSREINRAAYGILAYPLNRAKRIEFSAGARIISFQNEIEYTTYDYYGNLLDFEQQKLTAPASIKLLESNASFVHDTSVFGATSPVMGRAYRFDLSGTTGTLTMVSALADFRQYLMVKRPFTLAGRVMHYGRYGKGSRDERLTPLFLGYPEFVRGHDYNSYSYLECPASSGECPVFDRLQGSRILVGNLELRFPLFGLFGASNLYGPLPIEVAAFYDAGVAWGDWILYTNTGNVAQYRSFDWKNRADSIGVGARINMLGYMVVEVDYVKPLDRPDKKKAHWQFSIMPGF